MYDFTILILEGAIATGVAVTRDILFAAETLAPRVGVAPLKWRLCSVGGGALRLQGGMTVETVKLPAVEPLDRSIWVIPGFGLNTPKAVRRRLDDSDVSQAIDRLVRHVGMGGEVAAACSAVFMLSAAGLLEGRRATTTWWLAPLLQELAPGCKVDADRMVWVDGPVTTAGAAFAQTDLMLHLLRERSGSPLANLVSRMMLIDGRQSQAPFIIPEVLASGSDLVANVTSRVEAALPNPPSVNELAREFCVSERTLSRHIHKATGKSTVALVQSVRLRRARALLENSRMTIEQIAAAVGYQDVTSLRRAMKKSTGANPGRFRGAISSM